MKVSIVIPNWNGKEKLERNLPKVLKVKGVDEVIISDDASEDGSLEFLKKEFPEVELVERSKNGGFSSNVNSGVKEAKGELVFLLNTDAVPEENCLSFVIPHFEDPKVFSVSFNTGGNWSWAKFEDGFFWHYMAPKNGGPSSIGSSEQAHQTLWAGGGSGIFRKSMWEQLGGLDEIYNPFYEEDVDLGYRATKRGYINLWEPNAKVEHYKEPGVISENFSKSKIAGIAERNQLLFIWKNITSEKLFSEHKIALIKKLLKNPKYFSIFLAALAKQREVFRKREVEKKEAKIKDEEIFSKFS